MTRSWLCSVVLAALRLGPWALLVEAVDLRSSEEAESALQAVARAKASILELYGDKVTEETLSTVEFFSEHGRGHMVERLLRAFALRDSFVIAVGGMSDVAGHGNLFEESYPNVCGEALKPVFEAAGVRFDLRNMAMGGVPSFPNSVCMADNFGSDVDVVVWDFRMVERDEIKGELYIRQAMMLPKAPFVMFKRKNGYLKSIHYAHGEAALHVVDEMTSYNHVHKLKSDAVMSDKFCEQSCDCPGQVRWHSGWKMQRFRGNHMAWQYLVMFEEALQKYVALLGGAHGGVPAATDARWHITPRKGADLHKPISKHCREDFCSATFNCGLTWNPVVGRKLIDLVDPQLGLNGWKLQHPSKRVADLTKKGHGNCHYRDEKLSIVGNAGSHWIFFNLPDVPDDGLIAFCGDFQSDKFADYALIVVNQEEVMDKLSIWLESKTLGISSACFATKHNVMPGDNVIGFRVTSGDLAISLTHVLWTGAQAADTQLAQA